MDIEYVQAKCLDWICDNNISRVIIQFKRPDLKYSLQVINYLREKGSNNDSKPLKIYVTQSNTCCVDLLVTQHVSNVDGIIHVGNVCVSKPELKCDEVHKPLLFVFGRPKLTIDQFNANVKSILGEIRTIIKDKTNALTYVLFDTSLVSYATSLEDLIQNSELKDLVHVANLKCPVQNWSTTSDFSHKFIKDDVDSSHSLGYFVLPRPVRQYDCAIYIGQNLSMKHSLEGPSNLWKLNVTDGNEIDIEKVNVTRLLNKRIALINRLKDEEELKIGIIVTNPLPNITQYMTQLESHGKVRKHTLYFFSMIQTTDEYKIGNFDLCDAFVIINSCTCSTILESLVFNRPILTDLEFKLACGFEAEYGRVLWPGSSSHLSEEDLINRRKVSDISLALVHTRNELLERCSLARVDKWSGLRYKATSESGGEGGESLDIEEGLTGIASSYISEPLKRPEQD